jgi:MFS family permease
VTRQQRLTLVATILGSTIVFLDSTVVNVALPAIQRDLGTGLAGQQWVVEAYLLTLVALLLVGGMCAFAIAERLRRNARSQRSARYVWLAIAVFFVGLSADETSQLHERTGTVFTLMFGRVPYLTQGAWLLMLLPLIAVFYFCVVSVLRYWAGLYPKSRKLVLGGIACWTGVLIAEFVQAQLVRWSSERSLQGVLEEGLEVIGAALFVAAFIEYLRADLGKDSLERSAPPPMREARFSSSASGRSE